MAIVPDFDPTTPSIARVYDYLLDGKDNFAVDREVAERMMAVAPLTAEVTRENRQFLSRAVTWAANRGITQFIDLACQRARRPARRPCRPGHAAGRQYRGQARRQRVAAKRRRRKGSSSSGRVPDST